MTYKPSNFDNSPVLRSLERLAIAKGLVPPDEPKSMVKEAAAKIDAEDKTLTDKIMRLCEGLRSKAGMETYANEIESKFLTYKKAAANSLYDVHGETGADLIEFAHPEGSKKLDKNWDDLGEIETILDHQRKMLEVVNKKPKGKLASKDIINAVKIVMAQEAPDPLDTPVD